jgi:hypothetical protein
VNEIAPAIRATGGGMIARMRLRVGNTLLPANSTDVTALIRASLGRYGNPLTYTHTLSISGSLDGDTQAECATAEAAVRLAFSVPYQDVALLLDDGSVSPTKILNAGSISGVRCLSLAFPNSYGGAEYATVRSFQAVFEAEYLAGIDQLVDYSETVSIIGNGGPRRVVTETINTAPVEQIVSPKTAVRASQSGRAVGLLSHPAVPRPLWPAALQNPDQAVTRSTPRPGTNGLLEWEVAWSYQFLSATPLTGTPARPPKV